MIYTSYFANIKKLPQNVIPVSIARFTPKGIDIPVITELAPSSETLMDYKKDSDKHKYIDKYTKEVLNKYTAKDIISMIEDVTGIKDSNKSITMHVALCCFEKPVDFCHRHLIADYYKEQGLEIKEINDELLEQINNTKNNTITFTGRRPNKLLGYSDIAGYTKIMTFTYDLIKDLYLNRRVNTFITGGAQGFDQLAFRAVHKLKKDYPEGNIKNVLYLPCRSQCEKWADTGLFSKQDYKNMLKVADEIYYISDYYTSTCLNDRNKAMIDNSSIVIALREDDRSTRYIGGTANAVNYAKNKDKEVIEINFSPLNIKDTLKVSAAIPKQIGIFGINEGIICQQVNCRGVMGAGLAKAIYEKFPIVKEEYLKFCKEHNNLLGEVQIIPVTDGLSVCNLYTQTDFGNSYYTHKCYTDVTKLTDGILKLCIDNPEQRVYIPIKIGCGLAGGNWDEVLLKLTDSLDKNNCTNAYLLDTYNETYEFIDTSRMFLNASIDDYEKN